MGHKILASSFSISRNMALILRVMCYFFLAQIDGHFSRKLALNLLCHGPKIFASWTVFQVLFGSFISEKKSFSCQVYFQNILNVLWELICKLS